MEEDFEKFLAQTKNVPLDPALDAELDELMKDDHEYKAGKKKIKKDDSSNIILILSKLIRLR
jgi:hypothetical protein